MGTDHRLGRISELLLVVEADEGVVAETLHESVRIYFDAGDVQRVVRVEDIVEDLNALLAGLRRVDHEDAAALRSRRMLRLAREEDVVVDPPGAAVAQEVVVVDVADHVLAELALDELDDPLAVADHVVFGERAL